MSATSSLFGYVFSQRSHISSIISNSVDNSVIELFIDQVSFQYKMWHNVTDPVGEQKERTLIAGAFVFLKKKGRKMDEPAQKWHHAFSISGNLPVITLLCSHSYSFWKKNHLCYLSICYLWSPPFVEWASKGPMKEAVTVNSVSEIGCCTTLLTKEALILRRVAFGCSGAEMSVERGRRNV